MIRDEVKLPQNIRKELLDILHKNTPVSVFGFLITALLGVWVSYGVINTASLIGWICAVTAICIYRLLLTSYYHTKQVINYNTRYLF